MGEARLGRRDFGARGRLGWTGRRAVPAVCVSVLLLTAGACATGQDVADVRAELRVLAARQDSAFRALMASVARGNERALDSLAVLTGELFEFRGDVNSRLVAIREQQLRMGELAGQSQRSLESLRQDVSAQRREMARQRAARETAEAEAGDAEEDAVPEPPAPDPEIGRQNYQALVQHLDRGNFVIAKQGFAGFVEEFPNHEFTPAAYLHLGELSSQDDLLDEAVAYYLRIPSFFRRRTSSPTPSTGRVPCSWSWTTATKPASTGAVLPSPTPNTGWPPGPGKGFRNVREGLLRGRLSVSRRLLLPVGPSG